MRGEHARWSAFERVCLALALAGVLARLAAFSQRFLADDAAWYATMARSLLARGEFFEPGGAAYTQHFPPLFPAFVALFFLPSGPSLAALKAANLAAALLFVLVAFLATRDLYGRAKGLAVAAIAACCPILVGFDALGLGETLVATVFALTIWAIVKSLDAPRFILFAGLFAGLGYLAKASMGPFVLLAAGAGLAWRVSYVGWGVLRDKLYLAAGGLFALVVAPWIARNVLRHGNPDTQPYATDALRSLFANEPWPLLLASSLAACALVIALLALPFLPGVRASWRKLRDPRVSALWMAVATPTLVAVFFVAAFAAREDRGLIFGTNLADRYVITPLVPLLWLGLTDVDLRAPPRVKSRLATRHALLAGAGLVLLALAFALRPTAIAYSLPRAALLFALLAGALGLLAASRASTWDVAERVTPQGRELRAQRIPPPRGAPLAGFALLVVAFAWDPGLALLVAAAAAFVAPTDRLRVLAVAAAFLGASLAGAGYALPVEDVARDAGEGKVAVLEGHAMFVAPFADASFVENASDASLVIEIPARGPPAPPPGFHLAREYEAPLRLAPGTWVEQRVEAALLGAPLTPPFQVGARVYARD